MDLLSPPIDKHIHSKYLKYWEALDSLVVPVESMNLPVAYNSALVAQ